MFRWILLFQASLYLLLMPFLRSQGEIGYHPPLMVGLVGLLALLVGTRLYHVEAPKRVLTNYDDGLLPRSELWVGVVALAVLYSWVSYNFGLLDRRQGSEVMAELYGTLPLWALAVVRGYELMLPPLIILYTFAGKRVPAHERIAVALAILISIPFMGISTSRGRLLVLGMTVLAFVPVQVFVQASLKHFRLYLAAMIPLGVFFYISSLRASAYNSFGDYLHIEVFQRLDGLNLVAKLREATLLSYWGEFDTRILSPLISKIPFLEAAREAKLMGRTSSKQYYIQDVLKDRHLDDSNSMITDPLYFGGVAGLIICFVAFGYMAARFDAFNARGRLLKQIFPSAVVLAFGTSCLIFENDFVSVFFLWAQTLVGIALLLAVGCERRMVAVRLPAQRLEMIDAPASHPAG